MNYKYILMEKSNIYIFISNIKYDITNFQHPVPVDFKAFNGKDMTELFMTLHDDEQFDVLKKYKCDESKQN
jgi:cytochrome b involved in lipid metabolism